MSREYGRVFTRFWNSPGVRAGTDDTRLLQLYLLTGVHSNMLGCYLLPDSYVSDDLQWSGERVRETLSKLFDQRFAERFLDGRHIVIINFLKWNPIENPNIATAALRLADQLPWTDPAFRHVFKGLELNQKRFGAEWQTVAERYAQACRNMEQEQEQEREQEQEKEQEPDSSLPLESTEQSDSVAKDFEAFWSEYPQKKAKQDAEKVFRQIVSKGKATAEELIEGVRRYAADCIRAGTEPKFIKYPAGWLRAGMWKDESAAPSPAGRNNGQSAMDYARGKYGQ